MYDLLGQVFSQDSIDSFMIVSSVGFWVFLLSFFVFGYVKKSSSLKRFENKIAVLEDICDRADIRISKLKHELEKAERGGKYHLGVQTQPKSDVKLSTYQKLITRIQKGDSPKKISKETGVSVEELEVLSRLVEVSSDS